VDILNYRVHQFNLATGKDIFFNVGDVVGSVASWSENTLIMALRHSLAFLDTQTGVVSGASIKLKSSS
jgi:sugar lactone lactonase YvrE